MGLFAKDSGINNEITFGLVTLRVGDRMRETGSQKRTTRKSEPEGENLAGI